MRKTVIQELRQDLAPLFVGRGLHYALVVAGIGFVVMSGFAMKYTAEHISGTISDLYTIEVAESSK
ncbi:MAG: hypothetical protein AAF368_16560 [Planctomycetota bacterium]